MPTGAATETPDAKDETFARVKHQCIWSLESSGFMAKENLGEIMCDCPCNAAAIVYEQAIAGSKIKVSAAVVQQYPAMSGYHCHHFVPLLGAFEFSDRTAPNAGTGAVTGATGIKPARDFRITFRDLVCACRIVERPGVQFSDRLSG